MFSEVGRPGNMAFVRTKAILVVGVLMAAALHGAAGESYTVGGTSGWIVPSTSSNKLYETWASNNNLTVGDSLVFNFATSFHNVLQVTKANYDSCTATSPLKTHTIGPATVSLTEAGTHYYICGIPTHCTGGQKLAITVSAASKTPTSPTTSTPPTTPTSTNSSDASYHPISSLNAWMGIFSGVAAVCFHL